ncbi:MAG: ActS/PrrB/RegB family redox-sensitive histidine kinase [Caulobacteraceae bacterium]
MASSTSYSDIVGSPGQAEWQGDAASIAPMAGRGLRLDTLITLRWIGLLAEGAGVVIVVGVGGVSHAMTACALVVLFSAAVNLGLGLTGPRTRLVSELEGAVQIGFDSLQLATLLFLTGGAANPFAVLLVAPVIVAASGLGLRGAAAIGALTIACAVALAFWSLPIPLAAAKGFGPPLAYRLGAAAAIATAVLFAAGYAWLSARAAARMELALHVTQSVLAREQRLSALGGLAAAAAHELGTPLATISVVAKELAREGPDSVREDAALLVSQAERCREILRRLTEAPDTDDALHARMSLLQLLHEVIEPHADAPVRVEAVVTGAHGAPAPDVRRMPEVLRAFTSLVDNAVDFAASDVLLTARYDADSVSIEVRDDGPGFAPDVLAKLGRPYVTSRPSGENSRSEHAGMGLGFFIAKTLLERTGARMEFRNDKAGGAVVAARWPRDTIEAPPIA